MATRPYRDAARLRKMLALNRALDDLVAAALRRLGDGAHDFDGLTGATLAAVRDLAGWTREERANLAEIAGVQHPPSDDTWAELVAHRRPITRARVLETLRAAQAR